MTIREIQFEMDAFLNNAYPPNGPDPSRCAKKVNEEIHEWREACPDQAECADVIIAMISYMNSQGYDADAVITKKLQQVLSRTDQRERDEERNT